MPQTADPIADPTSGLLAGRYRIEAPLGRGATGVVYRARRVADDAPVALKLLWASGDTGLQGRFLRGARLAARITHPGVVRTLDFGRAGDERGRLFVVMELVEGVPLDKVGPLLPDLRSRVGLVVQVLEALDHVHARGVLHRDIKPANILVSRHADGTLRARLVDFGLAAARAAIAEGPEEAGVTMPGTVLGTPLYMAPEQAEGGAPDAPSIDLYPVGVVLYQLLGGRLPFEGAPLAVLAAKLTRDAPPLTPLPTLDVPEALVALTNALVARRPADRPELAADVLHALEPFAAAPRIDGERWREALAAAGRGAPSSWSQAESGSLGSSETLDLANLSLADDEAPLPGREELVAAILEVAGQVAAGQGRALMLVAAPGMGRSTLMEQVAVRLAGRGRFRVLRATAREDTGLVDALRASIEGTLGVVGRGRAQVAAAARELFAGMGATDDSEAEVLAALLRPDADDASRGAEQQGRVFAMLLRLLRRLAAHRPVLLAVDDLDKGGPTAAALLEFFLFELALEPAAILLLGTLAEGAPASVVLARTGRYEGRGRQTLPMPPVPVPALGAALAARLGLPRAEALHIARRAAGSPLVAMLLAQGSASASRATFVDWRAEAAGGATSGEARLPMPLQDMLAVGLETRLARAPDAEGLRALLQDASVLGTVVSIELLAHLVSDRLTRAALDERLDQLLDLGLLTLREGAGDEAVVFAPELLGDLLRAGLHPRRSRRLHLRAFEARLALGADRLDAEAGALGDHQEALGDPAAAARWWLRGMRYELASGDALRGAMLGRRALDVLPAGDAEAGEAALTIGRLLLDLGDLDQAESVLAPLVEGRDADLALRAGDLLGDVYENRGAGELWGRLLDKMSQRIDEAGPDGRRAWRTARALWLNYAGRGTESVLLATEALADAPPGPAAQRGAQRLAFASLVAGDIDRALIAARRGLDEAGQRPDLRVRALRTLGVIQASRRDWAAALAAYEPALALSRRAGLLARVPVLLTDRADALRGTGDVAGARAQYREAARAAERLGMVTQGWMAEAKEVLCSLLLGELDGIGARTEHMLPDADASGLAVARSYVRLLRAWYLAEIGRSEAALEVLLQVEHVEQFLVDLHAGLALERLVRRLRQVHDGLGWTDAQRGALEAAVRVSLIQARGAGDPDSIARRQALLVGVPARSIELP